MKKLRTLIIVLIMLVVAAGACLIGIHYYYSGQIGFLQNTTLNGEDISGKTVEEIASAAAEKYSTAGKTVTITENGETSITATLESLGYVYDRNSLTALLNEAYEEQKGDIIILLQTLFAGYEVFKGESYVFDEAAFDSAVNSASLAEPRRETADAKIEFDEEADAYVVREGIQGNMIDDTLLRSSIKEAIDSIVMRGSIASEVTVSIPESVYTSAEPVNNIEELQVEADAQTLTYKKDKRLTALKAASITYTFGSETQVLTGDTFADWITIDDSLNVVFDDEKINEYIVSLSIKYNTRYHERTFSTSTGITVTIPESDNEYGYLIARDSEREQIKTDILSESAVTREPVYISKNDYDNPVYLAREGTDDLAGTYVEVNLTRQHLWFYKNYSLIVESDLVSGSISSGKVTKTGAFPLAWKQSPRTLTGDEAGGSGSYSTEVQYWMPFYDGQGLHDATWRSRFGGDIYVYNGSHGCVNLPYDVARVIYENIEPGTAIIVYQEPGDPYADTSAVQQSSNDGDDNEDNYNDVVYDDTGLDQNDYEEWDDWEEDYAVLTPDG